MFPFIIKILADDGYRVNAPPNTFAKPATWSLEIVKRSDTAEGFEVLPKWWIVEPTLTWISRCRRLARNVEKPGQNHPRPDPPLQNQIMAPRLKRQ